MSSGEDVAVTNQEQLEKLEQLVANSRGKKSTTQPESEEFTKAWVACAKEMGINDVTVKLLFDGFQIALGRPFYSYVSETLDGDAYTALFEARPTQQNERGVALKVAISLFALELRKPVLESSAGIIAHAIPSLSKSKEGKAFGNFDRSIHRILIRPLSRRKIDDGVRIASKDASAVLAVLKSPLENFAQNPKNRSVDADAATQLLAWLVGQANQGDSNESTVLVGERDSKGPEAGDSNPTPAKGAETFAQPVHAHKQDDAADVPIDMGGVIDFLSSYRAEHEHLLRERDRLAKECEEATSKAVLADSRLRDAQRTCDDLNKRLSELGERSATLRQEVITLKEANESLEKECAGAKEMLSVLDRRDSRMADESAKRLASELRVEYRDYVDAAGLPMDADLGENMREQLKNIFDILASNGIELLG